MLWTASLASNCLLIPCHFFSSWRALCTHLAFEANPEPKGRGGDLEAAPTTGKSLSSLMCACQSQLPILILPFFFFLKLVKHMLSFVRWWILWLSERSQPSLLVLEGFYSPHPIDEITASPRGPNPNPPNTLPHRKEGILQM